MPASTQPDANWPNILREIRSPARMTALVVLVVAPILVLLAQKATGTDRTILVVGIILLLFVPVVLLVRAPAVPASVQENVRTLEVRCATQESRMAEQAQLIRRYEEEAKQSRPAIEYDVFISSPMAAYSCEEEYQRDRNGVLRIMDALETECHFKVFYAAKHLESMKEFDSAYLSFEDDFRALRASRYFMLLYPHRVPSSVLFEAGWAFALRKPSLYVTGRPGELPFLMKQAPQARLEGYPGVNILEVSDVDELAGLIDRHGKHLFPDTIEELEPAAA